MQPLMVPAAVLVVPQQAWPAAPQAWHSRASVAGLVPQKLLATVQIRLSEVFVQHGCPTLPQVPHPPVLQVAVGETPVHVAASAVQTDVVTPVAEL